MDKNFGEKFINYKKVVLFGDEGVGKSSFINRIRDIDFQTAYIPSEPVKTNRFSIVGKDYGCLDLHSHEVRLGDETAMMYDAILFHCQCAMLIFDITNSQSFENVKSIIKKVVTFDKERTIDMILLANKVDEESSRQVSGFEIKELIDGYGDMLQCFEISAKTKENIKDVLQCISKIFNSGKMERYGQKCVYECDFSQKVNSLFTNEVYKIILLGDSTVGKSAFFNRFFINDFQENLIPTIGLNDNFKFVKVQNNPIKLHVWDTAGQERFKSLPRKYYQHADGILLIYDVTVRETFTNIVSKWVKDIHENANKKILIYLIGNKIDLSENRKVTAQESIDIATQYGMKSIEVSCRLDINVSEAMLSLINDIYQTNKKESAESFALRDRDGNDKSCCTPK